MSDFRNRFFSAFGPQNTGPQQTKLADVNPAAAPAAPVDYYQAAAAARHDTGHSVNNELFQDAARMSRLQLESKYGYDVANQISMARASGDTQYLSDLQRSRSNVGAVTDTASGALGGVVGSTGGILSLGAGIVNDRAGTFLSEKTNQFTNFLRENQTEGLQSARRASEARSFLNSVDNQAQYEEDIRAGRNQTLAALRRVGRDVGNQAEVIGSSGMLTGDVIAQGAGSLASGGIVSGGLKALGKAALSNMGARGAALSAGRVGQFAEKARMPGVIGAMEGGGAYMGAVEDIRQMSSEELMQGSQLYRDLIADNYTHEEAKLRVMNTAGVIAGAIQAPIGAATGMLTARFEANPLKLGNYATAGSNILKETLEEGVQSATGELSQNYAVRRFADNRQDMLEGVGGAIAEGMIGGAGAAGVFAGPSVAGYTARQAVNAATNAVTGTMEKGRKLNNRMASQARAKEGEDVAAALNMAAAPAVEEGVAPSPVNETLDRLTDSLRFDPQTFTPQSETEQALVRLIPEGETVSKWDLMSAAVTAIENDTGLSFDQKADLALMVARMRDEITSEQLTETNKLADQVEPGTPEAERVAALLKAQEIVLNSKSVDNTLRAIVEKMAPTKPEAVEDISTPEGRKAADSLIAQAEFSPEAQDPEALATVLRHSTKNPELFSARQKNVLRYSLAMSSATKELAEQSALVGSKQPNLLRVAEEVQERNAKDQGPKGRSVKAHFQEIARLLDLGRAEEAAEEAESFQNFAQSMFNKLEAINQSHAGRTNRVNPTITYQAYSQSNGWFDRPVTVRSQTKNSIGFAQQAGIDARYVVSAFNKFAELYPELGLKPLPEINLHPELMAGNPSVVSANTFKKDKEQPVAAKPEPVQEVKQKEPEPTPEPVAKPEPEPVVEEAKAEPAVTRITPDMAKRLSEKGLLDRIDDIQDRIVLGEQNESDAPTLAVLKAERDAREEALYEEGKKREAAEAKPAPTSVAETEATAEVAEPKAEPEAQTTEEVATEQTKPVSKSIKELFPDLIQDENGDQLLADGFEVRQNSTSAIMEDNPLTMNELVEAMASSTNFKELTGLSGSKVNADVAKAYNRAYSLALSQLFPTMKARLEQGPMKNIIKGLKPIKNNIRMVSYRLLNLMTKGEQGELFYHPRVAEAALFATVDLLAQRSISGTFMDKEAVGKKLGLAPSQVTDELQHAFIHGQAFQNAVENMAATLSQFLNISPKSDIPNGLTDGLMLSLATELLDAAIESDLLVSDRISIDREVNQKNPKTGKWETITHQKEYSFIRTNLDKFKDGKNNLSFLGQTTLIRQAVLKTEEEAGYKVGEPPKRVRDTQKGGFVDLTAEQTKAARAATNKPHRVNATMTGIYERLGKNGLIDLLGEGTLPDTLNKNDRLSKESRNSALASAYEVGMAQVAELQVFKEENGLDDDAPMYREYVYTSVVRLQQQGAYGDQASKLVRELITPTRATIDLTNPEKLELWRRAIAQAFGIKVEKLQPVEWNKKLDDVMNSAEIGAAIDAVSNMEDYTSSDLVQILKDAGIKEAVQLHALMSIKDFSLSEDHSNFTTHIYIESDGMTDGPTNSIFYMRVGGFDQMMVEGLKRGAFTFSATPTAAHDIFNPVDGKALKDTYEFTAELTAANVPLNLEILKSKAHDVKGSNMIDAVAGSVFHVMNSLIDPKQFEAVQNEDGSWSFTIGRNQLKNPLTVTVYGSGAKGIAEKLAGELSEVIYQEVSQANARLQDAGAGSGNWGSHMFGDAETAKAFFAALNMATKNEIIEYTDKAGRSRSFVAHKDHAMAANANDPVKFTLTPKAMRTLSINLEKVYIKPMVQAIQHTMGSSVTGSKQIQEATNYLSVLANVTAKRAIRLAIEKHVADGGQRNDGISPKRLQEEFSKISFLLPHLYGDIINVNVKGFAKEAMVFPTESGNETNIAPASTALGSSNARLVIPLPAIAGVAGAAFVNISYGDGRMIVEAMPNLEGGVTPVFDGINLSLDKAPSDGKAINEAVLRNALKATPFADLTRTFEGVVNTLDFDSFSEAEIALIDSHFNQDEIYISAESEAKTLLSYLKASKLDEAARLKVLNQVAISSDHMAAVGTPAATEGIDLSGLDTEQQAKVLQDMFHEARLELLEEGVTAEKASEDLTEALENIKTNRAGLKKLTTGRLRRMIDGLNIPAEQRLIINRALSFLREDGWQVIIAPTAEANRYLTSLGVQDSFGPNDHGMTIPSLKTIILTSASSETLAHELVHAATFDKVDAYYRDESQLDNTSKLAIRRLEALMVEWLSNSVELAENRKDNIQQSVYQAVRVISQLINDGRSAEALNEFMAWNLANQDLVKLNSTSKVLNKLALIKNKVIATLRHWLKLPQVGADVHTNIRFNTLSLMSRQLEAPTLAASEGVLRHSSEATDDDVKAMLRGFASLLNNADRFFEEADKGEKPSGLALGEAVRLADQVIDHGFPMTPSERTAFQLITAAFRANQVVSPSKLTSLDKLYTELLAQMNQQSMMLDENSSDPGEQILASKRLDLLSGKTNVGKDVAGRSMALPMFIALAATNPVAQELFNKVKVRDLKKAPTGPSFDQQAKSVTTDLVNSLMTASYGLKAQAPIADTTKELTMMMVQQHEGALHAAAKSMDTVNGFLNQANEKVTDVVADVIDLTSEGVDKFVDQFKNSPHHHLAVQAGKVIKSTMNVFSTRNVEGAVEDITYRLNRLNMDKEFHAFSSEIAGMNGTNKDLLRLVKLVRATVHRVRQTFRKRTPEFLSEQFTRNMTDKDWNLLHRGMGRSELAIFLNQGMTSNDVLNLLRDNQKVDNLIQQKEQEIKKHFGKDFDIIRQEMLNLVELMESGHTGNGLTKRNALAIANRVGSQNVGNLTRSDSVVKAIDAYTSLVALNRLSKAEREALADLATKEVKGMGAVLSMMNYAYNKEMERVPSSQTYNIRKGYMPFERLGSMIAVPVEEADRYARTGYRVVSYRQKSSVESLVSPRGSDYVIMASDVPTPSLRQGIMQTVRPSVFGVDAILGTQHDMPTAGLYTESDVVKRLAHRLASGNSKDENLSPIYNAEGKLIAFERMVDPSLVHNFLKTQSNAAVSLGQWIGRQFEEEQANQMNQVAIDETVSMWEKADRVGEGDAFIDLFEEAKKDPVIAKVLTIMNPADIEQIRERMDGKFMARKDLAHQLIGFHSVSIGDLWSGNTKLPKEYREAVSDFITGILGPKAYEHLMRAEKGWQNLMGDARVAIVVKSFVVPALNAAANAFQLLANGVGAVQLVKLMLEKTRETHLYAQNEVKYQELENNLIAAKGAGRADLAQRIETEMRKIEDLNKRLSIWPLIAAGEFSQVTEGLSKEDLELSEGRIWDYLSKKADALPKAVKTAGRYALVTKDTALFEGLARTVAYTDFVAKAVMYDHLTKVKKLSKEETMLRVTNEFVNYDLMGGRIRTALESYGLLWFWPFKLRSIKTVVSLVRNNPLHAFMTGLIPGVSEIGTPVDDNMISLLQDGRWKYSVNPLSATRGLEMLPIMQVIS